MQTAESPCKASSAIEHDAFAFFYETAEAHLADIRNGILIFLQDHRSKRELDAPIRDLNSLVLHARNIGLIEIEVLFSECEAALTNIVENKSTACESETRSALDLIARVEASLLKMPIREEGFFADISDFVDESFDNLTHERQNVGKDGDGPTGFEIDEETLEIFRSEASDLLETITANLAALTAEYNSEALWNIRRAAHTFKGAAGIVGMKEASELAHRIEDLLEDLAEDKCDIDAALIDLLTVSTDHLTSITIGTGTAAGSKSLDAIYADFDRLLSKSSAHVANLETRTPTHPVLTINATRIEQGTDDRLKLPPAPIVRVSLDRLDELLTITDDLVMNRTALAERLGKLYSTAIGESLDADTFGNIGSLFETQGRLTNEIQDKLRRIRMVRFGMLTTRLNRAVHVTCEEENKKAEVVIENEDVEIDTQILDSLVEPLLHLLRNAVVHGIEPLERRRLIGKPEKGQIRIRIDSGDDQVTVSVSDDGRGISIARLKEKAVSSGAISSGSTDSMSETEALDLMFLRGITTADTLNLNAGRGVGMSIVKESIEGSGGSISILTDVQRGTTFSIKLPLTYAAARLNRTPNGHPLPTDDGTSPKAEQRAGLRVLIVDDSPSMRQVTSKIIERAGWTASTAHNGLDAIKIISRAANRPDIIVTDLEMPGLDGYALLDLLKYDDEFRDIPVIMITSRSDPAQRKKAFELGVADFLTKPVDEGSLIEAVNDLIGVRHQQPVNPSRILADRV